MVGFSGMCAAARISCPSYCSVRKTLEHTGRAMEAAALDVSLGSSFGTFRWSAGLIDG